MFAKPRVEMFEAKKKVKIHATIYDQNCLNKVIWPTVKNLLG